MPFNSTEKLNNADKLALQLTGTANDAPGAKFWYNEDYAWAPIVPPSKVWTEFENIPSASNSAAAEANAAANPSLIQRTVIRLTLDTTTNNRGFVAREVYGDNSSKVLENFIQPSLIRTPAGDASWGYNIRLFHGDPNGAGEELSAVFEAVAGDPSWAFNYSAGIILVSTDRSTVFRNLYDTNGLYILGYRYVGETGGEGGGSGTTSPDVMIDMGLFTEIPPRTTIDCGGY